MKQLLVHLLIDLILSYLLSILVELERVARLGKDLKRLACVSLYFVEHVAFEELDAQQDLGEGPACLD